MKTKTKPIITLISLLLILSILIIGFSCATPASTAQPTTALPTAIFTTPQPVFVLRGETMYAENYPTTQPIVTALKLAEQRSNGRLKIDVSYGGALTTVPEALDAVRKGLLDWSFAAPSYYTGVESRFLLAGIPVAFKDLADYMKAMRTTELGAMLERATNKFNIHFVGYASLTGSIIMTKTKPVRKLEDMKGLKIRTPGQPFTRTLELLGATPTSITTSELYTALERGTIDGAFVAWNTLTGMKLTDIIRYINPISLNTGTMLGAFINMDTWKRLPTDIQALIEQAFQERELGVANDWVARDSATKDTAIKAGIEIINVDAAEEARWKLQAGAPSWQWIADQIGGTEGALFLKVIKDWHGVK